jgi:hypothetical protein
MDVIDHVLAVYDTRLARGTVVATPPGVAQEAALDADLVDLWRRDVVVRLLIAGRAAPDTIAPAPARRRAPCGGPRDHDPRLAAVSGRVDPARRGARAELVLGAVGRFWAPRLEWRNTAAEEFAPFWEPGWGKIAAALRVEPSGENQTVLICETRTAATDPLSGLRFRRYWLLARPGVWLILGRVLAGIRRDAEARAAWSARRMATEG